MKRSLLLPTVSLSICLGLFGVSAENARCQESQGQPAPPAPAAVAEWYYGDDAPKAINKSIAQQKAVKRAEQRMARLESMKWFGFTPGRPTAAALPFTSKYSPSWTRPGGRPYAWYVGQRSEIVVPPPRYDFRYR